VIEDLSLTRIEIKDFRNLVQFTLTPAARFNVLSGDNGQGKTSVLESIYFLATSRSFRTTRLKEMRRNGAEFARVEGAFREGALEREQRAVLSAQGRSVFVDDQKASRLAEYAIRTPVVVFHPGNLQLSTGSAALRRDLLDRIGLFARITLMDDRLRFERALRERQKCLELSGERAPELDVYEDLAATHGARLTLSRIESTRELSAEIHSALPVLAPAELEFKLSYRPAGDSDVAVFRRELAQRRASDRKRRSATFGPHRDDLQLWVDGRTAREHASQGQHRLLALALKLAELAVIRRVRAAHPLLLLDDVSSELDPKRIGAVYQLLESSKSQAFITTTRADLFTTPGLSADQRCDFRLHGGRLV
jgi:DNA replication and repair protein RecF